MSEVSEPAGSKSSFSPLTLLIILILAGLVFALAWSRINSPAITGNTIDNTRTMQNLGLGSPTTNRLSSAYQDADQDLVADIPADASALRDPATLRFCFLNDQADETNPQDWQPFLDAIAEQAGKPVEYVQFSSVEAQLAALRSGALDVTAFNTGNVPRAVNAAGFVPVAAPAIAGQPATYNMLILSRSDSGIKTVEDLKGQMIALTRVGSNSGYKAPLVILLKDFGLEPERDFDWAFSGSHNASINGLVDGSYAVAAVASDLFQAAVDRGDVDESKINVVYRSEPFPRLAFGYAYDLQPELAQNIAGSLLSFSPAGTVLQEKFADGDGFTGMSYKDDFGLVRLIDDAVGFKHEISPLPTP